MGAFHSYLQNDQNGCGHVLQQQQIVAQGLWPQNWYLVQSKDISSFSAFAVNTEGLGKSSKLEEKSLILGD